MRNWVRSGLVWGGILYVITMVLFPLIDHEKFDVIKLLSGVVLWIVVGLIIGYLFDKRRRKKGRK